MKIFSKSEYLADPVLHQVFEAIKQTHTAEYNVQKLLSENRDIEGYCVGSRNFGLLEGEDPVYIHYDVISWLQGGTDVVEMTVVTIAIYENLTEHEAARTKTLQLSIL